ncbi:FecR family protein [Chitinophaga alhagiae]|uniref:FecR family protein n=1 Tax=Chitinophaga alhagiae TaxID=2203219 RepID=UPI0018E5A55A|nr:FecR family protein [Chitinophaga alhagiae]
MSYSQEELEALLQNNDFIRWVQSPEGKEHAYWQNWVRQQPDRQAMVELVRSIYAAEQARPGSHELANEVWQTVQTQMDAPVRRIRWRRYAAAAAVLALLAAGGLWYAFSGGAPVQRGLIVTKAGAAQITARNNGTAPKTVYLTDGTRITLNKNSSLQYSNLLEGEKREVYLSGEAFFEVAGDAQRPFLVYSEGIVTKVLGTSFRVKVEDRITVAVKSGKVAVSRQEESGAEELILLPNEQVVFNRKANTLNKTAVADASLLQSPVTTATLSFDEAPVTQVLDSLADMYTVNIQYNRAQLAKCMVTVSLEQESLQEKLEILCKVLGATYETHEHVIYLKAQGCN